MELKTSCRREEGGAEEERKEETTNGGRRRKNTSFQNDNIVVTDCGIDLTMSRSIIAVLLMCIPTWLRHTSLDIILIFDLFKYFFLNNIYLSKTHNLLI